MQSIKRFFVGLFREMAPVALFFFVAFLLIGLMFKLFVSQYEIEFSAFAKAAVAALVIGKVIAVLHLAKSGYAADGVTPVEWTAEGLRMIALSSDSFRS